MNVIETYRVLRLSSRKGTSTSYRVKVDRVGADDVLHVRIAEEGDPEGALGVFEFSGAELEGRSSLHLDVRRVDGRWHLRFVGPRPIAIAFGKPKG